MKILLITDLYPIKKDDSLPFIVRDFALGLKEMGNEITLIRPNFLLNSFIRRRNFIKQEEFFENGIKIYNRNFLTPFLFEKKSFLEKLKNENFDLIISHMPSGHLYRALINKTLKLPCVSIIHQSDIWVLKNYKYSFYFRKKLLNALKKADLIGLRNPNLKHEKLREDFILPSFLDKKFLKQKKSFNLDKKMKIITLSQLIKRKNLNLVIETLNVINKNKTFDFEYEIYGEGKEKIKLLKLIKKYQLQDKIKINNKIPHSEIFSKLEKNDVFILPSVNETFGLSYLEALFCGLITIGTKNTGIDGVIKNNENGFLIDKTNKEEIIKVLEKISKLDEEEKEKLRENIFNTAQKYEKEKIMTKYFENIKKILWK